MDDEQLSGFRKLFVQEGTEAANSSEALLLKMEKTTDSVEREKILRNVMRNVHNLKGSAKLVGFDQLSTLCHKFENLLLSLAGKPTDFLTVDLLFEFFDQVRLDLKALESNAETTLQHSGILKKLEEYHQTKSYPAQSAPAPTASPTTNQKLDLATEDLSPSMKSRDDYVRIPLDRLDDIFDSVGEQIIHLAAFEHQSEATNPDPEVMKQTVLTLKKIAADLQHHTLNLRVIDLKDFLVKLERGVRETAKNTGKKVICETSGAELKVDKMILNQISDALLHMVRNAVDHGLESSEERKRLGKPETGSVQIRATSEGGQFILEVHDDGRGLNSDAIRAKAIKLGLVPDDVKLSEKQCFDLIFESGLSTRKEVSEISGRGVGMNVVKDALHRLGGKCEIQSTPGAGTKFRMILPLSLSLYNGLCFGLENHRFIVPSAQVHKIFNSAEAEIREVESKGLVVHVEKELYRLVDLQKTLFGSSRKAHSTQSAILLCDYDGEKVCFKVGHIQKLVRVVQKPLPSHMRRCPGAIGVTISGDGQPVVILDLRVLSKTAA